MFNIWNIIFNSFSNFFPSKIWITKNYYTSSFISKFYFIKSFFFSNSTARAEVGGDLPPEITSRSFRTALLPPMLSSTEGHR